MKRIFTVDIHDGYRSYQIIDKMTFILLTYLKYFYFNEWVSLPLEFEKVYKCRAQLKTEKPPFQEKKKWPVYCTRPSIYILKGI